MLKDADFDKYENDQTTEALKTYNPAWKDWDFENLTL